ncbi:ribonuclease H protein, partial [Trifolium medium]|nr:ribonuclease H protein [Trifolium medium]
NGAYSVRSAYHQLMEVIIDNSHLKVEEEWQQVNRYMNNAAGFVSMIFQMIAEIDTEAMARITMLLWTIWWRRNQRCWQEKIPTIFEVCRRARDSLNEWLNVQQMKNSARRTGTELASHIWTKPARGTLKCNIDTAYYKEQNVYCIGTCLRDEQGRFMQAFMTRLRGRPDIAEAEATGLLEALRWLQQPQLANVQIAIETDCLQVAQALHTRPVNMTEFGSTIDLCHSLLIENDHCKVGYVRQQANRVAHALAQATRFIA